MSVYLQYVLSAVHCGTCSKGNARGSQIHDKIQQMHFYSGKRYLNSEDKNRRRIYDRPSTCIHQHASLTFNFY